MGETNASATTIFHWYGCDPCLSQRHGSGPADRSEIEPSSIDPHYHNLTLNSAFATHISVRLWEAMKISSTTLTRGVLEADQ